MRNLVYITLIFILSCSEKIKLEGDYKIVGFVVNKKKTEIIPEFSPTVFYSDSLMIYFNQMYRYSIIRDSIFLLNMESHKLVNKMGIEFVDENNFNFHYTRFLKYPEGDSVRTIPYQSQWSKIN